MPSVVARRRCPGLVFVRPCFDVYKAVSLDEAYLDVTTPLLDRGSATAITAEIRAAIRQETGLTASAGVSTTSSWRNSRPTTASRTACSSSHRAWARPSWRRCQWASSTASAR